MLLDTKLRLDRRLSAGLATAHLHLATDTVVDGIKDVGDGDARLVGRLGTGLVDTSLDQDAVPVVLSLLVDGVGTADVTLGSVTNEVNSLGRGDETVLGLAPLTHQAGCELESGHLGLAEGVGVELALAASQILEGDLEHAAEGAHAEADVLVGSGPDNVVVGEVNGRALVEGLAAGAQLATLGHGEIEHDLDVTGPVAGVGEDEDGINGDVLEVAGTRVLELLIGELAEGSGGSVVLDDVARSDDVLETVTLGDEAALLTLAANNEDRTVGLGHLTHGSVAADELTRLDVNLKLLGKVVATLLFGLTTTVGEEDVRNVNTVLILAVEDLHGLDGLGNGAATTNEDTIDIEGEDEAVGDSQIQWG